MNQSRSERRRRMPEKFVLFGAEHLYAVIVVLIVSIVPPMVLRKLKSPKINDVFAPCLGWAMIGYSVFKHLYGVFGLEEPWQIWLPLHMCHLANFIIGYLLITGKRGFLVDVAYFWTFGGASMAMITPDLSFGWPDPNFIMFMVTHALLFLGILYLTITERLRPTTASIWGVFKFSFIVMLCIIPINYIIGDLANYWYLREPPVVGSIMDFLPTPPLHIPFVVAIAYVLFWLMYVPYLVKDIISPEKAK